MPVENLIITPASESDAPQLAALAIITFRDTFGPTNKQEDMDLYVANEMNVEQLTDEINDPDNLFFLAWLNNEMIGYAKLRVNKEPEELKNNKPIEIERIYVLQDHGKKAGAALMSKCVSYALENKHDVVWLGVWEHNYTAVRFYRQWGFELFGSHLFILGNDHQTDVLMKKML